MEIVIHLCVQKIHYPSLILICCILYAFRLTVSTSQATRRLCQHIQIPVDVARLPEWTGVTEALGFHVLQVHVGLVADTGHFQATATQAALPLEARDVGELPLAILGFNEGFQRGDVHDLARMPMVRGVGGGACGR